MAKFYFKYGAMNSGKSALLQQAAHNYEEQGMKVAIIKPSIDTRVEGYVSSRIGLKRKADYDVRYNDSLVLVCAQIVKDETSCVLVDEAQFLSERQVEELYVFSKKYDIPVICYGLRADFTSHLFEGSKRLLELADRVEELSTTCICECGKRARFNARKNKYGVFVSEGEQLVIDDGQEDTYQSLCGECYLRKVLHKL